MSHHVLKLTGADFLRHPQFNKGSAFTREEREWLKITAQLPPYVDTLEIQVERCVTTIKQEDKTPLQRYVLLRQVQDTNLVLFYAILAKDLNYFLPIVYTPVVGEACIKFHRIMQRDAHGMYLSVADRGRLAEMMGH